MKVGQKAALALMRAKFRILQAFSTRLASRSAFDLFCTPQGRQRREPGAYFHEGMRLEVAFSTYVLRGYRWPGTGDRKALVIHGFHSSVLNFEQYIRSLNQAGLEVIAFDAPAHGSSSGNRINALIYRDFLLFLFEEYGPFSVCVAHSFGGLSLSLALAELPADQQPERVALISPATSTRTAMNQYLDLLHLDRRRYIPLFEDQIRQLSGQSPEWFSVTRAFPFIRSQVLWVHDTDDLVTPFSDTGTIREANYPNLEFVSTTGLGHRRIYQDPQTAGKIVRFLTANITHAPETV